MDAWIYNFILWALGPYQPNVVDGVICTGFSGINFTWLGALVLLLAFLYLFFVTIIKPFFRIWGK